MKTKPRAIGTAAETAVVRYLRANGWPTAERRSLKGTLDEGDITGTPGICWEVKGGNAARDAITATRSTGQVDAWLAETETERRNAGADVGILVVQTPGTTDPGRWWAVLTVGALCRLYAPDGDVGYVDISAVLHHSATAPVRMHLADVATLLRAAGYGDSLEQDGAA